MGLEPAGQQVNDTGIAGVIARPPLVFLAALLLGLASDRLLPWPFAVPGTDPADWMSAGSMILVGLRWQPRVFATSPGQGRQCPRTNPRVCW